MINKEGQVQKSRPLFWSIYGLLILLVAVRYVFRINLPPVILAAVMVLMICVGDRTEILAVCAACMPLTSALTHDYVLVAAIAVLAVKDRKNIRINLTLIPIVLLVIWELLHCLGGVFSPSQLVVMFVPLLLCGMLMWMDLRDVRYGLIVRTFALTCCVMCLVLVGMLLVQAGFSFTGMMARMYRLGLQTQDASGVSLTINPNSLSIMCVLAVCGLLQLREEGTGRRTDVVMMLIMLLCGILTLSRTYLVLLALMVILFVFSKRRNMKQVIRYMLMLLVIGSFLIILVSVFMPAVLEQYIGRFQVGDISGGRARLFRTYNQFIADNPKVMFFGIGLTDYSRRIMEITGFPNIPHNGIQEVVTAWGLPGLVLIMLIVLSMICQAGKETGGVKFARYIPLIILLAKIQAGQFLKSEYTMLALSFAYLSLVHATQAKDEVR